MRQSFDVLDFVPMGAFVLDSEFRVLFWNKCIETWTGLKAGDMAGQDLREHYRQLSHPKIATRLEDIFRGGPPTIFSAQLHRYIIPAPLPGGRMRLQNTLVNAVRTDDGYMALFTLQDVTEISHRLEQYIAMRNHALSEVEERRKAEREIREREAMYRAIFEKMRAVKIIVDPNTGAIVDVNTAACYFYGYPYPQLLRMNISQINLLPLEEVSSAMQKVVSEKQNTFEFRHRIANGEIRDVEVHSAPIELHGQTLLYSIIHDVTERKRAEKALRLSESKFRSLFDLAVDIIVVLDDQGIIREANQQVKDLLGYEKHEVEGHSPLEFFPDMKEETLAGYIRAVLEDGEMVSFEADLMGKDGSIVPVEVKARRLEFEGEPAILSITRDITARRKVDALREDVERITRHDLKNPLGAMLGLPDVLLQAGNLDDEQREILQVIRNAGYTILNMINLSLDLYKIETGSYRLAPTRVDILRLLEKIVSELRDSIASKKIVLNVHLAAPENSPDAAAIRGEEMLSYSMLFNLVGNAVDASPHNGTLDIELAPKGGFLRVAIRNQGAVPEDMRDRFFDKYATSGKPGGTGLGTFSAKLMAEVQGGSIGFESSEEGSTLVWVELPRP